MADNFFFYSGLPPKKESIYSPTQKNGKEKVCRFDFLSHGIEENIEWNTSFKTGTKACNYSIAGRPCDLLCVQRNHSFVFPAKAAQKV